ncbi:MAG: DUF3048 domain-containing protein [Actinomycetota bacterium]
MLALSLLACVIAASASLPAAAASDRDGDGLSDRAERRYRTDPTRKDTDRDGLTDGREVHKTKTNPRKKDTDSDTLSDGREVLRTKTNPRKKDTDGDTWADNVEIIRRTNPRNSFDPCPLTGLRAPRGAGRYATSVVVDNAPTSRPQAGLEKAEVVIEHPVEGGLTRFAAVYGCHEATTVGPVRSARFDSKQIVEPFTNSLAYSGANDIVQAHLDEVGLVDFTEQTALTAFSRTTEPAPDNLYVDVTKLPNTPVVGRPYRFGKPQGGTAAQQVTLNFGGTGTVQWQFTEGRWVRSESGVTSVDRVGNPIEANNVLVQVIDVLHSRSLFDAAGNPSPDFKFGRGGVAHLFREGRVITGVWTVSPGFIRLRTTTGKRLRLAIGRTWVEMVPSQAGDLKGTVSFG